MAVALIIFAEKVLPHGMIAAVATSIGLIGLGAAFYLGVVRDFISEGGLAIAFAAAICDFACDPRPCGGYVSGVQRGSMSDEAFNHDAWLERIGYSGSRAPTLETLQELVAAHSSAIAYESIDALLDRPPKLNLAALQSKMIFGNRGGYCFEQNMLFRAGLQSLGYQVTSLQARVVRGLEIDAPRPMLHMVLRVDLPEGSFLADVGFGNLAPTTALKLSLLDEQATPHEVMRFMAMGEELVLQAKLGDRWEHIYRVVLLPRFDAEYEICNWFTGTHPQSPYLNNLIAARPGPNATRLTLFNARFNVRHASGHADRRTLDSEAEYRTVLTEAFGIALSDVELKKALAHVAQRGTQGPPHPFFA